MISEHPHMFMGRDALWDLLGKRLQGLKEGYRQNVAIVGPKTLGKTSLLTKWVYEHDDPQVVMVYLDLDSRDADFFISQFVRSLLYHYLKSAKLPLQEDAHVLCASAKEHIPQTAAVAENILSLLAQQQWDQAYAGLLSLPEVFSNETKKYVVLIIDEFHCLGQYPITNVYAELGRRIMTQKNCMYVLTSSYRAKAEEIIAQKLSLLFGHFEVIELEPLDGMHSIKLLEYHLQDIKCGLHLKNFLADFTGGHPLYINILGHELVALSGIHGQKEIYAPLLTAAFENVLFNPWGVLNRHFELTVHDLCKGKSDGPLVATLMALSMGHHRLNELTEALHIKSAQVTQRLQGLMAADLVAKNGNFFYIKDKLFKYWIKYVQQRRLKGMDLEAGRSRKLFKEEINKSLNDYISIARKDLSSRMVDLLHRCGQETFDMNGRRYKLADFREVTPIKLRLGAGSFMDAILADTPDGRWVVVLKKDPVLEGEINALLEETKRMMPKPSRCVIVSLSGFDDNAKIRALEEKCWVWREQELNMLMHLYDQPGILR